MWNILHANYLIPFPQKIGDPNKQGILKYIKIQWWSKPKARFLWVGFHIRERGCKNWWEAQATKLKNRGAYCKNCSLPSSKNHTETSVNINDNHWQSTHRSFRWSSQCRVAGQRQQNDRWLGVVERASREPSRFDLSFFLMIWPVSTCFHMFSLEKTSMF